MKRLCILLSAIALFELLPATLPAAKPIRINPTNARSEKVLFGKKERGYHRLAPKTTLRIEVEGPGTLTVGSRVLLPDNGPGSQRYSIVVREGRTERARQTTQADRSTSRTKNDNIPVGKLRKTKINLKDGLYRFDVALENTAAPGAMMRFTFERARGAKKQVPIEALSYGKVVTARVKERLITYYVATPERKVQVRVIGPTTLKVTSRLNFDAAMVGKQRFTVVVQEKEKTILRKTLSTSKALDVSYKELKDVSPGKAVSFIVKVPPGEHRYTLALDRLPGKSAGFRFAIPETDLKNEE